MILSDLSEAELSRLVAEAHEASSNFTATCRDSQRGWWKRRYLNGAWIVTPHHYSDPHNLMRMLKELPYVSLCKLKDANGNGYWFWCCRLVDGREVNCDQPERAIAEASLLASGWKEK